MNCYGISDIELKIICTQIERRARYRKEFLRLRTDPCLNSLESGCIFDPALQRFLALKATQLDNFAVNSKTIMSGITAILPFFVYGYFVWRQRDQFLRDCRCGKIRYKDRRHKLA